MVLLILFIFSIKKINFEFFFFYKKYLLHLEIKFRMYLENNVLYVNGQIISLGLSLGLTYYDSFVFHYGIDLVTHGL